MNSTFSTDLVAPWTEDSKALLEKLGQQWRTAVTLHRGQTPGSAPSHIKLNYGKTFLCILIHLLAFIRLKSHQRLPVQSYLCSWALQHLLCLVLPLLLVRSSGLPSLSGLTVKSSLELGAAGSAIQFGLSGGLSSQNAPLAPSSSHTGAWDRWIPPWELGTNVFSVGGRYPWPEWYSKGFVQPGKTGSLNCLCFTA